MITRKVRLQVLTFLVVSLLGVAFVGQRYVGLGDRFLGGGPVVYAEFGKAGGIFENASVTYRGVQVGRVGAVTLHGDAVRAELRLDPGTRVSSDLIASVELRSAVGEQYVDLRPNTDSGPYLDDGDVIPRDRTSVPLPIETFLVNFDLLIRSVGVEDLSIVVNELGKAFEGNETALRRILDANSLLLAETKKRLPETLALLRDGNTVLKTQLASADGIRRWAAALAKFSDAMRKTDPDLRRVLAVGPPAAKEMTALVNDLEPAIGYLLGNLVTINGIQARRLAGIEQMLVTYPLNMAGAYNVVPGGDDPTSHLGLAMSSDPHSCNYVKNKDKKPNGCDRDERGHGASVRGWQNAPRPGGSESTEGGGHSGSGPAHPEVPAQPTAGPTIAGFDPATGIVIGPDGQPIQFGGTGGQDRLAGEQSWKQLLLAGLAP